MEVALGRCADAHDFSDGEGVEDLLDGFIGDDGVAIGFVHVGCEFGEELVWCDADGAGEVEFLFDKSSDFDRDVGWCSEEVGGPGDIEECFVDGDGLDCGGESFEDLEDLFGDFGV